MTFHEYCQKLNLFGSKCIQHWVCWQGGYNVSGPWCWFQLGVWLWGISDISGLHFPHVIKYRELDKLIPEVLSGSPFYDLQFCCHQVSRGSTLSASHKFQLFQHLSTIKGLVKNITETKNWQPVTPLVSGHKFDYKFEKNLEMTSVIWTPWWSPTRGLVYKG